MQAANPSKDIISFNFSQLTPIVNGIINDSNNTIELVVPYGTDISTLVPTIISSGVSVSPLSEVAQNFTIPVEYTVTAADSSIKVYTASVIVDSDPIKITFNSISSALKSSGIVNNLDTVTAINYNNFSGLFFEKRSDVYNTSTVINRITFDSSLDLSSFETINFLQNIETKMDVDKIGTIGLNFTGETGSTTLNGASATIKFYGLNNFGYDASSTAEELNSELLAFEDDNSPADKSMLILNEGTYLGACEFEGGCYVFTIKVNHFTKYKLNNIIPINQNEVFSASLSKKGGDLISIASSGDEGNNIWFAPDGTHIFTAGDTMTKAVNGVSTSILSPAVEGDYKLYVVDSVGNISLSSIATLKVDNLAPSVIKIGNGLEDVTIAVNSNLNLIFSEELSDLAKISIQSALINGADKIITFSWNENNNNLTIIGNSLSPTTFSDDVIAEVSDVAGNTISLLLIDSNISVPQIIPIVGGGGGGSAGDFNPVNIIPCLSANYDDWQSTCFKGVQYRKILNKSPFNCVLTNKQNAELQRPCLIINIEKDNITTTSKSDLVTSSTLENNSTIVSLEQIFTEARIIFSAKVDDILSHLNKKRDEKFENDSMVKYTNKLIEGLKIDILEMNVLNNFIVYGTKNTQKLGVGERAGVLGSYREAYGKLPATEADWADLIKISLGRWPIERNINIESQAKIQFRKVYLRPANLKNNIDENAIMVIAYGLRPVNRNMNSEAAAIKTFKVVYSYMPNSSSAWDIVRSIAYSGAKR